MWGRCGMWVVGSPEVLRSWGDVRSLGVMGLLRGLRGHWRGHGVHRGSWGHRGGVGRRGVMGSWGDVGSLGRLGGQWGMWDHGGVRDRWSYGVSTESGVPGVTGCGVRGVCGAPLGGGAVRCPQLRAVPVPGRPWVGPARLRKRGAARGAMHGRGAPAVSGEGGRGGTPKGGVRGGSGAGGRRAGGAAGRRGAAAAERGGGGGTAMRAWRPTDIGVAPTSGSHRHRGRTDIGVTSTLRTPSGSGLPLGVAVPTDVGVP